MQLSVQPGQLVLLLKAPMPPSTNRANRAVIRERKNYTTDDALCGKKPYYPAVRKDAKMAAYKEEARLMLRLPQHPWHAWQEPMVVRALREDLSLKLDFDLWEVFADDKSDADNRIKEFQDILCEHLEINDRRIINPSGHKLVRPGCTPYVIARLRIALPYNGEMEAAESLLDKIENERTRRYDRKFAETRTVPVIAKSRG